MKYVNSLFYSFKYFKHVGFICQIAVPMSMEFDDFAKQRESGADETNSKIFLAEKIVTGLM